MSDVRIFGRVCDVVIKLSTNVAVVIWSTMVLCVEIAPEETSFKHRGGIISASCTRTERWFKDQREAHLTILCSDTQCPPTLGWDHAVAHSASVVETGRWAGRILFCHLAFNHFPCQRMCGAVAASIRRDVTTWVLRKACCCNLFLGAFQQRDQ